VPAPARLRAATRGSDLARWQTDHVAALVRTAAAAQGAVVEVEPVVVDTVADRHQDIEIWQMGGKGVFVKEVQAALLDGRADLAVHSAKDLPARRHPDLVLAAVPERADPRDVLVGSPRSRRAAPSSWPWPRSSAWPSTWVTSTTRCSIHA
jgi:hydroxymethylbilane synthase